MKKFLVIFLLLAFTGCRNVSKSTADEVRDQHAVYHSYVSRMDDDNPNNNPTADQNEQMVRNALMTFEALDRGINNWEPKK